MTTNVKQEQREAGRELDALIAEKVMGWVWATAGLGVPEDMRRAWLKPCLSAIDVAWHGAIKAKHRGVAAADFGDVPHYSTDIAAAWHVVEKMREKGFFMALQSPGEWTDGRAFRSQDEWLCHFQRGAIEAAALVDAQADEWASTPPHAICLASLQACAALSAVRGTEEDQ